MEVVLNEEELQVKCAEWQRILRLQDWTVDLHIKRQRDFSSQDCNAEISLNEQRKIAFIKIIDPADYDPEQIRLQDMEADLVHELLHIHFWPLTRDQGVVLEEENAINMISDALISLSRNTVQHTVVNHPEAVKPVDWSKVAGQIADSIKTGLRKSSTERR